MARLDSIPIRELLAEAMSRPVEARAAYIAQACGGRAELEAELLSLVGSLENSESFLATPTRTNADIAADIGDLGGEMAGTPEEDLSGTKIGRYALLERIGEGGFGTVFHARQEIPVRREVALKVIKLGMDTRQVIARFQAERQALAMMDHPHIARVIDAGATDLGRPYFVMELVEGGVPITRYCDEHRLTISQRLELFVSVCQAVQHAHGKGIIHRDLKPSNILVGGSDGTAAPKIIDFGIAKAVQGRRLADRTLTGGDVRWVGTPQYMSPEQADGGRDVDTRSDVYMLGVVLYELLSGTTPFGGGGDESGSGSKSSDEIQRMIREVDPPSPSTRVKTTAGDTASAIASSRGTEPPRLRRLLRGELDWIAMKCLEKDPARRYETAAGLAADVQRYLRLEPVTARQTSGLYRLRKLVRRNRLAFASLAALLAGLLAGLIISTWALRRAVHAERDQRSLREDAENRAYDSDMLAAQQALAVNNLRSARELLDRHRPKPGERDLRGWEWRYLWQQSRSQAKAMLPKRPASVCSLAVSNDGKWLAIGDEVGGGLLIWDLNAQKEYAQIPAGDAHVHCAFSPKGDWLAYTSATSDANGHLHGQIHLWDVSAKKTIASKELNNYSQGIAFSHPDGQTMLTSTARLDGALVWWKVPSLVRSRDLLAGNAFSTLGTCFAVTPDFSAVVLAPGQTVRLSDLPAGTIRWSEDLAPGSATAVAVSPDGLIVAFATGAVNPTIHLLDARSQKPLGELRGHLGWISALLFRPDGKSLSLISAAADQTIRVWDVSDPARAGPVGRPLRGHTNEVRRLALDPDGVTLVSGDKDGQVCIWDLADVNKGDAEVSVPALHFAFDEKGSSLFTMDAAGLVLRREGTDLSRASLVVDIGKPIVGGYLLGGQLLISHSAPPGATTRHAFSKETGDVLESWDLQTQQRLHSRPPTSEPGITYDRITPRGRWLAQFEADKSVLEWDLRSGKETSWHFPGTVVAMAFTPDGAKRLTLTRDGKGSLADTSGSGSSQALQLAAREICGATFSQDGSRLAVNEGGYVGLWKTAELRAKGEVPPYLRLGGFSSAPTVRQGYEPRSNSVAFSPDGKRLAAGLQVTEAIKIWSLENNQEVLNLHASGSLFNHTEFSPDGTLLASSNDEGELHIWRAPTQAEIDAAEASDAAGHP
jgi:serine/threonine protein kinase/WD40 repeat protein